MFAECLDGIQNRLRFARGGGGVEEGENILGAWVDKDRDREAYAVRSKDGRHCAVLNEGLKVWLSALQEGLVVCSTRGLITCG